MGSKTTLRDVARVAGVSPATVTRLATGTYRVSPAVAERVRNAAAKLGVDLQRTKKAIAIGFLLSNREMLHPFHSRILAGVEAYCAAREHYVLFLPYRYLFNTPWGELHVPQVWRRRDIVCGFIVAGVNSQNLLELLSHEEIPFAVLGNNVTGEWRHEEYDVVYFDDIEGSYEVTRYLQMLGHRDIWFVANCQLSWFARRYEGYRRAILEVGLTPRLSETDSDKGAELGYLATKSVLARGEPVSAIFAGDDPTAQGVYKALDGHGLRIPEDVSVVGFSDVEGELLHPPLTTVRAFPEQVGKHLAQQLLNRVLDPDLAPQHYTMPTQLVVRASCRPLFPAPGSQDEARPQANKREAVGSSP